jgi:hypothetical protein
MYVCMYVCMYVYIVCNREKRSQLVKEVCALFQHLKSTRSRGPEKFIVDFYDAFRFVYIYMYVCMYVYTDVDVDTSLSIYFVS